MSLKSLSSFLVFQTSAFLDGKRLVYVKAEPWKEDESILGSRVVLQIIEDKTAYPRAETTNFGEQLTVKVRNVTADAFVKLKPLATEILVQNVEKAVVYGEYRNQLSIIATIAVKDATPAK